MRCRTGAHRADGRSASAVATGGMARPTLAWQQPADGQQPADLLLALATAALRVLLGRPGLLRAGHRTRGGRRAPRSVPHGATASRCASARALLRPVVVAALGVGLGIGAGGRLASRRRRRARPATAAGVTRPGLDRRRHAHSGRLDRPAVRAGCSPTGLGAPTPPPPPTTAGRRRPAGQLRPRPRAVRARRPTGRRPSRRLPVDAGRPPARRAEASDAQVAAQWHRWWARQPGTSSATTPTSWCPAPGSSCPADGGSSR